MKKIIIINSAAKIDRSFFDLFADMDKENDFSAWVGADGRFAQARENWEIKKKFFGPEVKDLFSALVFAVLLPALWFGYYFLLISQKRHGGIAKIICATDREKLIFTPLAVLLKIGVTWLEMPGSGKRALKKIRRFFPDRPS